MGRWGTEGWPLADRFWAKVEKTPTCWLWTAATYANGYGVFRAAGKSRYAHRIAYELAVGVIPDGLVIDHLCRNPGCVRPDHLEPVTQQVNVQRGDAAKVTVARRARQTHCLRGHPLSGDNLYRHDGRRICRACRRAHGARHDAKRRAARG